MGLSYTFVNSSVRLTVTVHLVKVFFLMAVVFLWTRGVVLADEFTSTDFKALDPVIFSSGYSTSADYQLLSTISPIAVGTSTAADFKVSSGFLFYPFASLPVVSATIGSAQVALSWTASQGFLGWTPSGYNVGQATISGGTYTYSASLGNVLSSTRTGLTNGATYYFVIRVEDALGNSIATSSEVSAVPVASAAPASSLLTGGESGAGFIRSLLNIFLSPAGLIAETPILLKPKESFLATDLNGDGKVDIEDFGVFLYFSDTSANEAIDFNKDGRIGLADLGILFYDWTGVTFVVKEDHREPVFIEGRIPSVEERYQAETAFIASGKSDEYISSTVVMILNFLWEIILRIIDFFSRLGWILLDAWGIMV